ncbi:BCCT family transporter [Roseibium denhamense]|uniref:Glycine betaine transporter n=1 Tax=Roseibium denhamense TaxID=76305 RepID=A0ABY1PLB8_9HYPH|nr:BCCT family transporter [Roseibium denhamense]MTI07040.1 BCCT family transporter [Roseibium denhamense]SMP36530.1 glycine betaine transporter [Roseibium denhamense]
MRSNYLLLGCSISLCAVIGIWGVADPQSLQDTAQRIVDQYFVSRGWFVMLSVTIMLLFCLGLVFTRFGDIRLGVDTDRPEYATPTWIAMLFAAGMGVGLLFWAVAEPLTHFAFLEGKISVPEAADAALLATNFNWGIHAWAIYGTTALAIAYFSYRRGTPMLVSAPLKNLFPGETWASVVGWFSDFMAISAIAIGVAGSVAMGVFQVADGLSVLAGAEQSAQWLIWAVFAVMIAAYIPPLMVDLSTGMAKLSNIAMSLAIALVAYTVIMGPTEFLMNSVIGGIGMYVADVIPAGLRTFTFYGDEIGRWFQDWTLTYMVWWIAWGPFVGVFVARISKGRTIREFVLGVLLGPTLFSTIWFGAFGGVGIFETLNGQGTLLAMTQTNVERMTFALLDRLPFATLTTLATVFAAFLFIVTSVVSAAFVLGMFSTGGNQNPSVKIKVVWGCLLGVLGTAMILSGSMQAVRTLIALGALPFVFITVLLLACLIRALLQDTKETDTHAHR